MSRGSTLRHAQKAGDLGFALQFNVGTPWSDSPQSKNRKDNSLWVTSFIPPNVKHAIAGYLKLPQPTPASAQMRELH